MYEINQYLVIFGETRVEPGLPRTPGADFHVFKNDRGEPMENLTHVFGHYPLQAIEPLFPGKTNRAYPGGIERLFRIESTDLPALEAMKADFVERFRVEYVEPDHVHRPDMELAILNDAFFPMQYALRNTGQTIGGVQGIPGADINAFGAWSYTQGSRDVVLAIIDSGLARNHPEFAGRVMDGYSFVENNSDWADRHGHGTAVTSVAAATGNNGRLMAGLDWHARILPVRVGNEIVFTTDVVRGLVFAADRGANVANISSGGTSYSRAYNDAVNYALENGVIITASMGNNNTGGTRYPAAYGGVIAVGATNKRDERAVPLGGGNPETSGSNYGDHIDFVAPGNRIALLAGQGFNQVVYGSGTSVSAPLVAAVITLMLSLDPKLTRDQVYDILKSTTRPQLGVTEPDTGWDRYHGWGRVDAGAAVLAASGHPLPEGPVTRVYPNPTPGKIHFSLREFLPGESFVAEVYGLRGEVILRQDFVADRFQYTIDLAGQRGGLYFLRVIKGDRAGVTKFIKY